MSGPNTARRKFEIGMRVAMVDDLRVVASRAGVVTAFCDRTRWHVMVHGDGEAHPRRWHMSAWRPVIRRAP
jgi:hypothetical protein